MVPVACSTSTGNEPIVGKESVVETVQEKVSEKVQEKVKEPSSPEKSSDGGVSEPVVELVPERNLFEPSREEVSLEPSTPDDWVQEVLPEVMFPKAGLGQLSGQCNVLDKEEWNSSKSFMFRNTIDFGTMSFNEGKLSPGGQKIWKDGNLGGSSVHSEVFAYEVLYRCEDATLLKSEGEIVYQNKGGKKTDLLVLIDNRKIGVSVTRAFHFPPSKPYTEQEATTLLTKKLKDIPLSAKNADKKDAWVRSMLHILAYNKQYADMVEAAYRKLDSSLTANILLMVTVTDGKDDHIY